MSVCQFVRAFAMRRHWNHLLNLLAVCQYWTAIRAGYLEDNYPAIVIEDSQLNTLQLLAKYKYPAELHNVTTEDKYVLQMHRIARPGAKPVLLLHGLLDTSATWIMMGAQSSFGHYLYEAGYDVWLGNARGSRYGRAHTKLDPDTDMAYWSFSFHEIGLYDLPAMIDAVLAKTGYAKLSYFGHSQGTTTMLVLLSTRPEYNAKFHVVSLCNPVAYTTHLKTPFLDVVRRGLKTVGPHYEMLPHSSIMMDTCLTGAAALKTCMYFTELAMGRNPSQLNKTLVPLIFGQLPGGCNSKQPLHYLQLHQSSRFCPYDYGAKENQRIYGRATPPDYAVEKVTAPIALYYNQNDNMAAVEDVQRLIKRLPNVVENHLCPYKNWNHVDIIWGISSRRLIQPRMLQVMQKCEARGERINSENSEAVKEDATGAAAEELESKDNADPTDDAEDDLDN